jgi:deazaflavin-dependent oxidoreductase (nitroreductase family)
MAYLKPGFFPRLFNKLAMRFGLSGSHTLEVKGRTTGETQRIPVIPVEHGGALHVVSTRGESEWVRNVRAAGAVELHGKQADGVFRVSELAVPERPPVIAAYREKAGRTVDTYWKKLPEPEDHPVFRLEQAASSG